jgi:amidase
MPRASWTPSPATSPAIHTWRRTRSGRGGRTSACPPADYASASGWPRRAAIHPVHADCLAAARNTARVLESLGHSVEEASPAALDDPDAGAAALRVVTTATARDLAYWSERTGRPIGPDDVEPMIWAVAEMGRRHSGVDYLRAVEYLHAHTRRMSRWWADGFDLLLTPTLPEPPPPLGQFAATADDPLHGFSRGGVFVAFTLPFNVTGQPAMSLPLHWTADGLPVGVQLVAAYGREDVLVRVAAQLEAAQPWAGKRPPVFAGG